MAEQEAAVVVETPVVTPAPVETPAEPTPAPVIKTYSQEEMDRITAKVKKNATYRAKKEVEAYYKGLQQGVQVVTPKTETEPAAPAEPKRESYADYESYLEARADYRADRKVEERLAKDKEKEAERSNTTAQEKAVERFKKEAEAVAKEIEDFQEVMETSEAPLTNAMRDAIYETEIPARIAYELAKNPQEAQRIAALSSARQGIEIGRLEAKLLAVKAAPSSTTETPALPDKPVREPSKAPEPIKPVGGKTTVANEEPDARTQPNEWTKWRQRQVQARQAAARKQA